MLDLKMQDAIKRYIQLYGKIKLNMTLSAKFLEKLANVIDSDIYIVLGEDGLDVIWHREPEITFNYNYDDPDCCFISVWATPNDGLIIVESDLTDVQKDIDRLFRDRAKFMNASITQEIE